MQPVTDDAHFTVKYTQYIYSDASGRGGTHRAGGDVRK